MITLKLMPDYHCWPLWHYSGEDKVGNIDPHTLPLKSATLDRLEKWIQKYDDSLDWDQPNVEKDLPLGFWDDFEKEGLELWNILIQELKSKFAVVYFSQRFNRVFSNLKEYQQMKK